MWVKPTIFYGTKSIEKKYREKINIDTFQLGNAFSTRKNLLKKNKLEKINISTINREKFFDRSAEHK